MCNLVVVMSSVEMITIDTLYYDLSFSFLNNITIVVPQNI